jgi:hypothetical protein
MTPHIGRRFRPRRGPRRTAILVGIRGRGKRTRWGYRFTRPLRSRPTLYTHPYTSTRWVSPERFRERFVEVGA